jgi:hypothetical protein
MDVNNLSAFEDVISKKDIFDSFNFNIENKDLTIDKFKTVWITFNNCTFNCKSLSINNIIQDNLVIEFNNCTFNCDVSFYNCKIETLKFLNTKNIKSLKVNGNFTDFEKKSEIKTFWFSNTEEVKKDEMILSTSFSFFNVLFKKYFEFNNINNSRGIFSFKNNVVGNDEFENVSSCVFHSSNFSNVIFADNEFNAFTSFKKSSFSFNQNNFIGTSYHWNDSKFERNEFKKVNFNEIEVLGFLGFANCDFLSTTRFEKCKNIINSHLNFIACEFKGFVMFNRSALKFLNIERCTFEKSVSFSEAFFIKIKLFEIKFGGGAYFDEMRINNVDNKSYLKDKDILDWKRTLRAIKQELQKTENKIDFHRFRSYELAAYYEELGWEWRYSFKDKFILWASKWSSNFGISWTRAFWFTILSGIFWYSILYRIENSGSLDFDVTNEFFVGLFRFFLVTDFYNPLLIDVPREFLKNGFSWLIFIIGKIFIAFGIYEMIQSFRKFKA